MSHDFAKKIDPEKKRVKSNKTSTLRSRQNNNSGWIWFSTGFIFGLFVCGLAYISGVAPEPQNLDISGHVDSVQDTGNPKPQFHFFNLLPEQKIELPDVKPLSHKRKMIPINQYLLQAGSFKNIEDADRRRAELILLGMDTAVSDTKGSNGRWYRVQVGPFETRSKLAKARSTLTNLGIDTLLLKRAK